MKIAIVFAACILAATPAFAKPIDGTWKADLSSAKMSDRPNVWLLQNGTYSCSSCVPALTLKADGAYHAVTGRPYADEMAVKVIDARTVEQTQRKGGRVVGRTTSKVSPDGKTLVFTFVDSGAEGIPPVTGKGSQTRISSGPRGAHAMSGSWKMATYENISDNGLIVSFKATDDALEMTSPTGQSYVAKFDGTDAPIKGDPGGTVASVKRVSDYSYVETDKRGGKVVSLTTMTISPDGRTMKAVYEDKERGSNMTYVARKQ